MLGGGKAALIRSMKARGLTDPLAPPQPCSYAHHACSQPRLDGYEFCLRHILEDKASPFKQCSFTGSKTGRRCPNPAPKTDRADRKEGFCTEHARRLMLTRMKASRKRRPRETAEALLEELDAANASASDTSLDPKRLRRLDSIASKALEYATSSDSDTEPPLVDQAWRWEWDNNSDADSIDSDQEDPLKHAGVYSQEEGALLLRDKLIRLQSLYIEQFKRLQHVLREKRRSYLHTYRQEREMLGSTKAYKQDPVLRRKYDKLQAMKRYHKFRGMEALLHQKCNNRRIAVAEGINHRPPNFPRCNVSTADGRCNQRVLPLSKVCMAHILKDPHQQLFQPCSFRGNQCSQPVWSLDQTPLCKRHYAASVPAFTATHTQTEDPTQVKEEKLEVDDALTDILHDELSSTLADDLLHPKTELTLPDCQLADVDITVDALNSSGETTFDLGDVDVSNMALAADLINMDHVMETDCLDNV